MPRACTTADVFNAIAEPRRRQIMDLLARRGGVAVGSIAATMGLRQPAVSKHLAVLRKVGVVSVSRHGQQRRYKLEAGKLKSVHDWVKTYERFWSGQIDRIKQRAERKARDSSGTISKP